MSEPTIETHPQTVDELTRETFSEVEKAPEAPVEVAEPVKKK